jgi:hypothetical protein
MYLMAMSILVISNTGSIQACTPYENCIRTIPHSAIQIASFNGNHGTYGIPYSMSNGTLVASLLDLPAKELLFTFNATGDGKLTVELPRQVIDSTRDGKDKPYLVFVGTWKIGTHRVKATEIQNNNEMRTLEIGFTKGDNHIGIVGTYFIENNSTSTMSNHFGTWSPRQQYEKGFDSQDVVCKSGLQLLIKAEDDTPACVKYTAVDTLIERGWARPLGENEYQSKYRFDLYPTTDYQNNLLGIQNRTYDFMILNDTMTRYHNPPLQIVFHGVAFTLLPSMWTGRPVGSCGGYQFRVDAKFDDGSHEQIGTFVRNSPCSDNYTQTNLSIHTNPQVGVTVLHQSVRLLVSSVPQASVQLLRLSLSTNSSYVQYGHTIRIDISLNNTSSDMVTIGAASNPPRDDLNTGACENLPFGITILRGYYTQENMTNSSSLPLFPTPPCPLVSIPQSYTFQPLSTRAAIECSDMFSCNGYQTMERHLLISGSLQYASQSPFSPGVYTIVGGDEWGRVIIQHFTVTNSSD